MSTAVISNNGQDHREFLTGFINHVDIGPFQEQLKLSNSRFGKARLTTSVKPLRSDVFCFNKARAFNEGRPTFNSTTRDPSLNV
jgi:hypothetical protein